MRHFSFVFIVMWTFNAGAARTANQANGKTSSLTHARRADHQVDWGLMLDLQFEECVDLLYKRSPAHLHRGHVALTCKEFVDGRKHRASLEVDDLRAFLRERWTAAASENKTFYADLIWNLARHEKTPVSPGSGGETQVHAER